MAISVLSYGGTYGTGLTAAQMKTNKTALGSALAAAIAADDYVLIPAATTFQVCTVAKNQAVVNATNYAKAFCQISSAANPIDLRGSNTTTSVISLHVDWGDGVASKVMNNIDAIVERSAGTAVGTLTKSGNTMTLTVGGEDFVTTDDLSVGDYITLAGWPTAGNNGTFLITTVTATTIRWTNVSGAAESADGDSTFSAGPKPRTCFAGLVHAYNISDVEINFQDFKFEGLTSYAVSTAKDYSTAWLMRHDAATTNDGGTNTITFNNVTTTGLLGLAGTNKGSTKVTVTSSNIQTAYIGVTMYDNKTVTAKSTMQMVAGTSLVDGETFTINGTVFEINKTGGVSGGNTAVTITDAMDSTDVRDAVITAVNGSSVVVTAHAWGISEVRLYADTPGTAGNLTCSDTVANATFTCPSLTGGTSPSPPSRSGRELIITDTTWDAGGALSTESTDGDVHGIVGYVHPHTGVRVERCTFSNAFRGGVKQYTSSDGVTDCGNISPQVVGQAAGVGMYIDDLLFTGLTGDSAQTLIDTTDGPVTCNVNNMRVSGTPTMVAAINPRCTTFNLTNCNPLTNVRVVPLGVNEERQTIVNVNLTNIVASCSIVGGVALSVDPGWRVTLDNYDFTRTGGDANTFSIGSPEEADTDYPYDGWLVVKGNCSFTDTVVGTDLGDCFRGSENAPMTFESGVTFTSSSWRSAINLFTDGQMNVTCTGVDFSGVSSGRGIYFQTYNATNVLGGSLTGSENIFPAGSTIGGIDWQASPAHHQTLTLRAGADATVRTATSSILKISPNYQGSTATGSFHTINIGLGTEVQNNAFSGSRIVLVAGAAMTRASGGNVTWLATGASATGTHHYLTLSNGSWTEGLPEVSVVASDSTAVEPDPMSTGTFTVTRTHSTAYPLTVNMTYGGTATSGSDYTALSASVVIAAGSTTGTLTVTPLQDADEDGGETVIASIAANAGYTVTGSSATVTITNSVASGNYAPSTTNHPIIQKKLAEAHLGPAVLQSAAKWFKPVSRFIGYNPWKKR